MVAYRMLPVQPEADPLAISSGFVGEPGAVRKETRWRLLDQLLPRHCILTQFLLWMVHIAESKRCLAASIVDIVHIIS